MLKPTGVDATKIKGFGQKQFSRRLAYDWLIIMLFWVYLQWTLLMRYLTVISLSLSNVDNYGIWTSCV